jgi:hypothetical protein
MMVEMVIGGGGGFIAFGGYRWRMAHAEKGADKVTTAILQRWRRGFVLKTWNFLLKKLLGSTGSTHSILGRE